MWHTGFRASSGDFQNTPTCTAYRLDNQGCGFESHLVAELVYAGRLIHRWVGGCLSGCCLDERRVRKRDIRYRSVLSGWVLNPLWYQGPSKYGMFLTQAVLAKKRSLCRLPYATSLGLCKVRVRFPHGLSTVSAQMVLGQEE